MACADCVSGAVHEGTPTGTEITLAGLPTYAVGDEASKRIVIFGHDIFGWKFVNTRLLADEYAARGFRVLVPDLYDGAQSPIRAMALVYSFHSRRRIRGAAVDAQRPRPREREPLPLPARVRAPALALRPRALRPAQFASIAERQNQRARRAPARGTARRQARLRRVLLGRPLRDHAERPVRRDGLRAPLPRQVPCRARERLEADQLRARGDGPWLWRGTRQGHGEAAEGKGAHGGGGGYLRGCAAWMDDPRRPQGREEEGSEGQGEGPGHSMV